MVRGLLLAAGSFCLAVSVAYAGADLTAGGSEPFNEKTVIGAQGSADHVPGELLVKFKKGIRASERRLTHTLEDVDVLTEFREIGIDRVKTRRGESTDALLQRYRQNPNVEYAEPNVIFHAHVVPDDPLFSNLWGMHNTGQSGGTVDADIDAPEAWDSQVGNPSTVIAVIDSGVDFTHPDLAANLWVNPGEIQGNSIDDDGNGYVDDYRGWDFANNDNNPSDDSGHGSHTSGIIAAVGNNGAGVTGVAWQAKVMPLKFLNASGSGLTSDAVDAILYAANKGVRIVNASWGCNGSSCFSQALEDAIAYANTNGVLFVVAAGNDGTNNDVTPDYPCVSIQPNIICVAATTRNDQLGSFSNYGATSVDLGAPGAAILSTVPSGFCAFCDVSRYLYVNGTSSAAPHVSGAAALIVSQFPSYTVVELKDAILGAVDPLPSLSGKTVTGGRLNVQRALQSNFAVTASPATQTINAGGSTSYTVSVNSIGTFTGSVTLTFSASNIGLAGSFSPGTVSVSAGGTATSTLSVTAQAGMSAGSYSITIRGTATSETHSTVVTIQIAPPDLTMAAVTAVESSVTPGGPLNVSNTVQNLGGSNAGAFTIAFHLSGDALYGGMDDVTLAGTRSVSSLAMGSSSSATSLVVVPSTTPAGNYYVCAMADSGSVIAEAAENNNTSCSGSTTTVNPGADLSVAQSDVPDPVAVGGGVTYTITVTNNGPEAASGVTLTDTLPTATTFGTATPSQGTCNAPSVGVFTCSLGTLPVGGNATVTLVVTTGTAGMIGNTATITAAEGDPNSSNNTSISATNVGDVSRLTKISTRGPVLTSPNLVHGGFVIEGGVPKKLLIRGRGPSLSGAPFNVPGTLANPKIDVYSGQTVIARNDNWQTTDPLCLSPATTCGDSAEIVATGLDPCQPNPGQTVAPPNCVLEAAVIVTLPPGPYTVIMSGVNGGTGVGLFGAIELDAGSVPRLTKLSTRGVVLAAPNLMHGGVVVDGGTGPKTVLIRGRGPSLSGAPFNVPGTLANPKIEVYSGQTVIARNDNWQTTDPLCLSPAIACGNAAQITATGLDPCQPNPGQTVAPPGCANEAAMLITLPPGPYTVIASGVNGSTGVALVGLAEVMADLAITKSASASSVTVGTPVTYILTVANNSTYPAAGVTVLDSLPVGVTPVSATSTQGSCTLGSTVTCSLGTVTTGAPVTITIVVTPTAAGTLNNTASVSGTLNDPDTTNNLTPAVSTTVNP